MVIIHLIDRKEYEENKDCHCRFSHIGLWPSLLTLSRTQTGLDLPSLNRSLNAYGKYSCIGSGRKW